MRASVFLIDDVKAVLMFGPDTHCADFDVLRISDALNFCAFNSVKRCTRPAVAFNSILHHFQQYIGQFVKGFIHGCVNVDRLIVVRHLLKLVNDFLRIKFDVHHNNQARFFVVRYSSRQSPLIWYVR